MNKEESLKKILSAYFKKKYVEKKISKAQEEYNKNKYYGKKKAMSDRIVIYNKKRKRDPIYRIIDNLSQRTIKLIKDQKDKMKMTHMQLIGCKPKELKAHLEKQFKIDMTFDNYGAWEVDHIKPIDKFDLKDSTEILKCFHYSNLQPLWLEENRSKSNKYTSIDT